MDDELDDPSYVPSEKITILQTKRQAIAALQSSSEFSEKFWHHLAALEPVTGHNSTETNVQHRQHQATPADTRYNFRPRGIINYDEGGQETIEERLGEIRENHHSRTLLPISTILQVSFMILLTNASMATDELTTRNSRRIQYIEGGVQLLSTAGIPYKICAEYYCVQVEDPKNPGKHHLPTRSHFT
ncbi:hypothetical protein ANCDUO_03798 [Ancylostoma duodenale]|uniref:Uncharacterized protein n=1 Tax=Ancylostoma duodenale TaxID=51022 RepID=A0A0C2DT08_9BILA|nr:hypothetical protein ANCDUO_03798 [Ancylostoma duodenale]